MGVRLITSNEDGDFEIVKLVKQEDTHIDQNTGEIKVNEGAMIYECVGIFSDSHKKRYAVEPKDKSKTKGNSFLLRGKVIAERFYKL